MNQFYYIDKTMLIRAVGWRQVERLTRFTRPRRFGKTVEYEYAGVLFLKIGAMRHCLDGSIYCR